jgi:hypothetical protein
MITCAISFKKRVFFLKTSLVMQKKQEIFSRLSTAIIYLKKSPNVLTLLGLSQFKQLFEKATI